MSRRYLAKNEMEEQGRERTQQRATSTTQQGNSKEAAPPTESEERPLPIVFSTEEEAEFKSEIQRLTQLSVICRVVGARPNRGECKDLLQASMHGLIGRIIDVQFMGRGFYHVELDTIESVGIMLEHSPLDVRGARAFVMPWKQGFNPVEAIRKGDRIFPLTIVFPGLRKEYLPMLEAIASRIGTVVRVQESMAMRLSKMSGFPSARILVESLENLPTKVRLPNEEGDFIEQKVEFAGLPGQCFYCRQMGHLAKNCPRRNIKLGEKKRCCEYCKQEGHEADKCQEKLASDCMGVRAQGETSDTQWINVKAKHGCKTRTVPMQETCLTPNAYNALDIETDTQEQPTSTTEIRGKIVSTIQPNDGCVKAKTFRSKRTIQSQKLDNAITIRTCGMLKEDTGNGGFSILDYAAPFGHDFTKHLGVKDVHEPNAIRVHVLFRQKQVENSLVGYSFPLCGYERNDIWNQPNVMLAMRGQVLYFAKYVQNPQLGETILRGLENASCLVVPYLDAMNRKHVVLDVPSDILFDFGYVYIHEDDVQESQAKARAHHHWRFIKEGCDILKSQMVIMGDGGGVSSVEPSSKTRRIGSGSASNNC